MYVCYGYVTLTLILVFNKRVMLMYIIYHYVVAVIILFLCICYSSIELKWLNNAFAYFDVLPYYYPSVLLSFQ